MSLVDRFLKPLFRLIYIDLFLVTCGIKFTKKCLTNNVALFRCFLTLQPPRPRRISWSENQNQNPLPGGASSGGRACPELRACFLRSRRNSPAPEGSPAAPSRSCPPPLIQEALGVSPRPSRPALPKSGRTLRHFHRRSRIRKERRLFRDRY